MSNTTYVKLNGPIKWAHRLFTPDTKFNPAGVYSVQIKLSDHDVRLLNQLGLKLKDRGEGYYTFKREHERIFKKGEEPTVLGPPKVTLNGVDIPADLAIGNTSEAEIELVVYKAGPFHGSRINKVNITELVEYVKDPSAGETPSSSAGTTSARPF